MNYLPDQLVQELALLWGARPEDAAEDWEPVLPEGVPADWNVFDFTRTGDRDLPCVVIGHDGGEREKAKGMDGTGRVKLRVVVMSDKDYTEDPVHRAVVKAFDQELRAIMRALPATQPLELVYLHAMLQEVQGNSMPDHRQITTLPWTVVATLCEPA